MVLLHRKLNFFKDPGGSNIFQEGPNFFQGGGLNANLNRNPYNLAFSRGVLTPYHSSGSAHNTRSNKISQLNFPFDISLLPCPWPYIVHWLCCTPAQ